MALLPGWGSEKVCGGLQALPGPGVALARSIGRPFPERKNGPGYSVMAMRVGVFSTKSHDRKALEEANQEAGSPHALTFLDARLSEETASLAAGFPAVSVFVND